MSQIVWVSWECYFVLACLPCDRGCVLFVVLTSGLCAITAARAAPPVGAWTVSFNMITYAWALLLQALVQCQVQNSCFWWAFQSSYFSVWIRLFGIPCLVADREPSHLCASGLCLGCFCSHVEILCKLVLGHFLLAKFAVFGLWTGPIWPDSVLNLGSLLHLWLVLFVWTENINLISIAIRCSNLHKFWPVCVKKEIQPSKSYCFVERNIFWENIHNLVEISNFGLYFPG
jgi:hypothetical protein